MSKEPRQCVINPDTNRPIIVGGRVHRRQIRAGKMEDIIGLRPLKAKTVKPKKILAKPTEGSIKLVESIRREQGLPPRNKKGQFVSTKGKKKKKSKSKMTDSEFLKYYFNIDESERTPADKKRFDEISRLYVR